MAVKSFAPFLILVFLALPAVAQDMAFPLPGCRAGLNCWILSYPDLDPAPGSGKDYACGPAAEDGDNALRIGTADVTALREGMEVAAAADGVVSDVNDGVRDLVIASRAQLKRGTPLCGNGVIIDHGLGLQTAYCHMRRGSIRVVPGQRVMRGQIIGQMGQSGLATWPQLAFTIKKGGFYVDPVTGQTQAEGCGFKPRPVVDLPRAFREYQPVGIVSMGFSIAPVTGAEMAQGTAPRYARIDRMEKTLNLWAMVLGIRKGDDIEITLRDPRGRVFHSEKVVANKDEVRLPVNATRARGYTGWREGGYTGEVKVTRMVENRPVSASRQVLVLVKEVTP